MTRGVQVLSLDVPEARVDFRHFLSCLTLHIRSSSTAGEGADPGIHFRCVMSFSPSDPQPEACLARAPGCVGGRYGHRGWRGWIARAAAAAAAASCHPGIVIGGRTTTSGDVVDRHNSIV